MSKAGRKLSRAMKYTYYATICLLFAMTIVTLILSGYILNTLQGNNGKTVSAIVVQIHYINNTDKPLTLVWNNTVIQYMVMYSTLLSIAVFLIPSYVCATVIYRARMDYGWNHVFLAYGSMAVLVVISYVFMTLNIILLDPKIIGLATIYFYMGIAYVVLASLLLVFKLVMYASKDHGVKHA